MNFAPKKVKHTRTFHKRKNNPLRKEKLNFNSIGIFSKSYAYVTNKQIEAGRRFLVRKIGKKTSLVRRITLTQEVTKKPVLTRMGKGKGSHKN